MEENPERTAPGKSDGMDSTEQKVTLRELIVVVDAKNHNPTILNPDFLKINEIVPLDWKVEGNPICVDPHAEVAFTSGIKIVAEFETITFSEILNTESGFNPCVPGIAEKYVKTLPHVDYTGSGLDLRGDVTMSTEEVEQFFFNKLVQPGPWTRLEGQPAKIGLRFYYTIDDGYLVVTVAPATREAAKGQSFPIVFFGANLRRQSKEKDPRDRLAETIGFIGRWERDVKLYHNMINGSFLREGR